MHVARQALSPMVAASGHRHHHGGFGIPADLLWTIPTSKQADSRTEQLVDGLLANQIYTVAASQSSPSFLRSFVDGETGGCLDAGILTRLLLLLSVFRRSAPRTERRFRPSFPHLLTPIPLDYTHSRVFRWEIIRPRALPVMPRHRRAHRMYRGPEMRGR